MSPLTVAHRLLVVLYLALPGVYLVYASMRGRREKSSAPLRNFLGAMGLGAILAAIFCTAYAASVGGRPHPEGVAITVYLATAMLLLLRLFDRVVTAVLGVLTAWVKSPGVRVSVLSVVRVGILTMVIIPYVTAAALTYRPHLLFPGAPAAVVNAGAEDVNFRSSDGILLSAWWFPAARRSDQTVILCPGVGSGKRSVVGLARALAAADFNVLAMDLRATGESGGHITTYGDLERRDVVGALRWVNDHHGNESDKIMGVGVGPGGAALIAAATMTIEGRNLSALVVADTYANLPDLARDLARVHLSQPLTFLLGRGSVPMAALQTGAPLTRFDPAKLATQLWPRPLLIVAAERSRIVPFDQTQDLYFQAAAPKGFRQIGSDERHLLHDATFAATIIDFLRHAEPLPVI